MVSLETGKSIASLQLILKKIEKWKYERNVRHHLQVDVFHGVYWTKMQKMASIERTQNLPLFSIFFFFRMLTNRGDAISEPKSIRLYHTVFSREAMRIEPNIWKKKWRQKKI